MVAPLLACLAAPVVALALVALPLAAQGGRTLATDARLFKNPNSTELIQLTRGTPVTTGDADDDWIQAEVQGWVPSKSLGPTKRDGFNVIVTGSGETLRLNPSGAAIGKLRSGTLLSKVDTNGTWTRVKRAGWIVRSALGSDEEAIEVGRPAALFAVPEGAELGAIKPGATGRTIMRSGDWVKVQLEGWMHESDLKPGAGAVSSVTAAEVRANPAEFVGKTVDWRVQFISMQVADELRPEMPAGQPYLLARGPLPEPGFVYVMVTREQLPTFRALPPLGEVTLRVTIRAAKSRYLPTPVVELVGIRDSTATAGAK